MRSYPIPTKRDERLLRIVRRTSPSGGRLWRFEQNDRRADRAALLVSPRKYQIAASGHRMLVELHRYGQVYEESATVRWERGE